MGTKAWPWLRAHKPRVGSTWPSGCGFLSTSSLTLTPLEAGPSPTPSPAPHTDSCLEIQAKGTFLVDLSLHWWQRVKRFSELTISPVSLKQANLQTKQSESLQRMLRLIWDEVSLQWKCTCTSPLWMCSKRSRPGEIFEEQKLEEAYIRPFKISISSHSDCSPG